jgi:hypothetical protein
LTVTDPLEGDAVYPVTALTANEYVPFRMSKNVIVEDVLDCREPPRVTDQLVPVGSPASVNVTVYVGGGVGVNSMDVETAAPSTVTTPLDGTGGR